MKKWEGTKITYELPNWVCLEAFIKSQIQTCAFGKGKIPDPKRPISGECTTGEFHGPLLVSGGVQFLDVAESLQMVGKKG